MKYIFFTIVASLLLVSCGGEQSSAPAQKPPSNDNAVNQASAELPVNLTVSEVEQLRQNPDVVLLDVREDWEYNAGHIPGSTLLPLGNIPNSINDIPKDKTVIAVCRSGNRSNQATQFLRQQGFENVHNMKGGMIAWQQANYEIE